MQWKLDITTPPKWAEKHVKNLYLFGSRSMAVRDDYVTVKTSDFDVKSSIASLITRKTDFDYAAPNSYKLRDDLIDDGWKEVEVDGLYHPCALLKGLFLKEQDGQTVQILLRSNHELFMAAWDSISPEFWYRYIWKSSPEFVFSYLDKKHQKKYITDIIGQIYDNVNRQYQWIK
jgi:hypothetical protein